MVCAAKSSVQLVSNSDEYKMAGLWLEVEGLWRNDNAPRMSLQSVAVAAGLGLKFATTSPPTRAQSEKHEVPKLSAKTRKMRERQAEKTRELLNTYQRRFCIFSFPSPFNPSTKNFYMSPKRDIQVPSSAWFGKQTTLEFWFYLDGSQAHQHARILSAISDSRSGFFIDITQDRQFQYGTFAEDGAQNTTTTPNLDAFDDWVHFALVKEDSQVIPPPLFWFLVFFI